MERELFASHLLQATRQSLSLTRIFVEEQLPEAYEYLVLPNQSYDGNPLVGDEAVFPNDTLPEGESLGPMEGDAVVSYLWRDGKVPEWIDVQVRSVTEHYTTLTLRCCGRYTKTWELLYHHSGTVNYLWLLGGEFPPFSAKGPNIPPRWASSIPPEWRKNPPEWSVWVERFGRFRLVKD